MTTTTPGPSFVVEWWYDRLYFEREQRRLAHAERVMSTELMAMYNRPQSVVDLNKLRAGVYAAMGVKL